MSNENSSKKNSHKTIRLSAIRISSIRMIYIFQTVENLESDLKKNVASNMLFIYHQNDLRDDLFIYLSQYFNYIKNIWILIVQIKVEIHYLSKLYYCFGEPKENPLICT